MKRGPCTDDKRAKIRASLANSKWRRSSRAKSTTNMQSPAGRWDEDYSTPVIRHHRRHLLWEEVHNGWTYL
jgi:hypothetical protein